METRRDVTFMRQFYKPFPNFKSPTAYLYHHMPGAAEKNAFLEHLLMTFPLQDDEIYCFDASIASVEQDKLGVTLPCVFNVAAVELATDRP